MAVQVPAFPATQLLVFGVVAAAFTNIYITQPVLPVIAAESYNFV